jgi:hypothetical protein
MSQLSSESFPQADVYTAGEINLRNCDMPVGSGAVSAAGESNVGRWCYRDYERRGEVKQGCDRLVW